MLNLKPGHTMGGSGRGAQRTVGRGRVDWVQTELIAQETKVPRTPQGTEDTSPERLSRSTNKRNPM